MLVLPEVFPQSSIHVAGRAAGGGSLLVPGKRQPMLPVGNTGWSTSPAAGYTREARAHKLWTDASRGEILEVGTRTYEAAVSILLNVLWIAFGGLWMAFGWLIAAVVMAITIIGLPWARAAFNIAAYTLLPFGQKAVSRAAYTGKEDFGTGVFGMLGNIIWLVLAGWWLALGHLITAIALAITLIGIPFAWAHLKLAGLALWPIGKIIVPAENGLI
jgi:uncharacterized membrane protein YccF (DUF307 family)